MTIMIEKVLGMATPLLGFAISLTDVSDLLRIVSLIVGISVGVVSFIHIKQKTRLMNKKDKDNEDT